jgi:hypothetical protein
MNNCRERLEASGLLRAFERARSAHDSATMQQVLEAAKFTQLEIESILWSKGDIGDEPSPEEKKEQRWNAIVGRIGIAILSGLILGGVFVYVSSGLSDSPKGKGMNTVMKDFRSPSEAYYRPFIWGFAIGSIAALITGTLMYDPTAAEKDESE